MIVIDKAALAQLEQGQVVKCMDISTFKACRVRKEGDKFFQVMAQKEYKWVSLYARSNDDLNLTQEETRKILEAPNHTITVVRSSGLKTEEGKNMKRGEQDKEGKALYIEVSITKRVEDEPLSPTNYIPSWRVLGSNDIELDNVKVI